MQTKIQYSVEMKRYEYLKDKLEIPTYQRKLVWSKSQKREFLESLSNGFPFGSLLLYKYDKEEKFSLIDGLQRFSTIMDYEKNPSEYYDFSEHIEEFVENYYVAQQGKKEVSKKISEYYKQFFPTKSLSESRNLYLKIVGEYPLIKKNLTEMDFAIIVEKVNEDLNKYVNLQELEIPFIEFMGDESQLAEVFEKINRGGVKLSKYQVFAAQWFKTQIKLNYEKNNTELLNIVKNRYEQLNNDRQIEIQGFDEEEFLARRDINMSELCYAIGKMIIQESYVFIKKNKVENEELANELGYSTIAIILGIPNANMANIRKYSKLFIDSDIEILISNILKIYREINDVFASVLKKPNSDGGQDEYQVEFSNFQYLSFFASLWTSKYLVSEKKLFEVRPKYTKEYELRKENFIGHYILDSVVKSWGNAGDRKIDDIYIYGNDKYLKSVKNEQLLYALTDWQETDLQKDKENISSLTKMILIIYYNITDKSKYLVSKKYDFEHIIPRKILKDYKAQGYKIPGGSLGNICLLSDFENRSKKELTVHQSNEKYETTKVDQEFLEKINYPSQNELKFLDEDRSLGLKVELSKELIARRSKDMINELSKSIDNLK